MKKKRLADILVVVREDFFSFLTKTYKKSFASGKYNHGFLDEHKNLIYINLIYYTL